MKDSPAIAFLRHAWRKMPRPPQGSWDRINGVMRQTYSLAISGLMEWKVGDLHVVQEFSPGYWLDWEQMYALAVCERHDGYCKVYEHHKERLPLLADNVESRRWNDTLSHAANFSGKRERLFVGATFDFRDARPTVTSFRNDGKVVACTYVPRKHKTHEEQMAELRKEYPRANVKILKRIAYAESDRCDYSRTKILKRYTVGRQGIIEDRKARKARR